MVTRYYGTFLDPQKNGLSCIGMNNNYTCPGKHSHCSSYMDVDVFFWPGARTFEKVCLMFTLQLQEIFVERFVLSTHLAFCLEVYFLIDF